MKANKLLSREPIHQNLILDAVSKVKENSRKKFNESLKNYGNQDKKCQWCQIKLFKNTVFCCDFCKQQHEKAIADYELARSDKENQRWSR